MTAFPGYPGGINTVIPDFKSSGKLIDHYSRNANSYPIMGYVQLRESPQPIGYWARISSQQGQRYLGENESNWPYGQVSREPTGMNSFGYIQFNINRYLENFYIDDTLEKLSYWSQFDLNMKMAANRTMVGRTVRAVTVLTTASNWQATVANNIDVTTDHTADPSSLTAVGGKLNAGTSSSPFCRAAANYAEKLISADTMNEIKRPDLIWVMNPNDANKISVSPEIVDYMKGSRYTENQILHAWGTRAMYGLPPTLYDIPVLVEDTQVITSQQKDPAKPTRSYVWPDGYVALVTRKGALDAGGLGPTYSTMTQFWFQDEMTVKTYRDDVNQRSVTQVITSDAMTLTALASGYLFTSATS